jgi:hypothetical protein
MTSETEDLLRGSKEEWERAEHALDRLIAAHHNLLRDGTQADGAPDVPPEAAPALPVVVQQPAAAPVAPVVVSRWPTVILLAALSISAALVMSAAIIAVAKLL